MTLNNKPDYLGHRQRLRERFEKAGFSGWHDYEILELVLAYCMPRRDTKPIAKELLRKFKTIGKVLDAGEKELLKIDGIGSRSAILLKVFREVAAVYFESRMEETDSLASPKAVYDYFAVSLKGKREEEFRVMFLNSRNHTMGTETLQIGTVDKSAVYPRKVVERALKHNAVSVIIAHNHPGGSLKPSQDDVQITEKLKQALETVDISLLDHVIISSEGYFSFKEKGIL